MALVVVVCVSCRVSGPTREHCDEAVRAKAATAVATCRAVYDLSNEPRDGGWLARALALRDGDHDELAQLARTIGDEPTGADAWVAYGDALSSRHDLVQAAIAYRRALDHRAPTDRANRARDASILLLTYIVMNEQSLALQAASIAYGESQHLSDPTIRGDVLSSVGGFLYSLGDLPGVEALLRERGDVLRRDNPFYVDLRNLEAIVHAARSQRELADAAFQDVIATAHERGLAATERTAQLNRIGVAVQAGDVATASRLLEAMHLPPATSPAETVREVFTRARVAGLRGDHAAALAALDTIRDDKSPVWPARIAAYRGRALAQLGRVQEAEQALLEALAYVEKVRIGIGVDALKPWFVRDWRHAFDDLFLLYVREGRSLDALQVTQRATARSFVDALAAAESATSEPTFERAARRLEGLRSILRSVRLSPAIAPADIAQTLASLGERHVISFYVADRTLWRIVTRARKAPLIESFASVDEVTKSVEALVENPDDVVRARTLGALLFPPHSLPDDGVTLYVALTEPISRVSIAALIVDNKYLVQRHALSIIPNLTVLAQLVRRPVAGSPSVVIGDAMEDLHEARAEARLVATSLGVEPLLGADAKMTHLTTSRAHVLHIATHTRVTPAGRALIFADGVAAASDIVDRRLAADVVVLTSCAAADPLDRDELGSLANAFLAAGSRAVIAPRWSVEDVHARTFARHFYAEHGDVAPIAATAMAQRRMIAHGLPTSVWSMFTAFGDDRPTEMETR